MAVSVARGAPRFCTPTLLVIVGGRAAIHTETGNISTFSCADTDQKSEISRSWFGVTWRKLILWNPMFLALPLNGGLVGKLVQGSAWCGLGCEKRGRQLSTPACCPVCSVIEVCTRNPMFLTLPLNVGLVCAFAWGWGP